MNLKDVIIIGGGPAGLNAAVVLGRCRRKVLLFDIGRQRNRFSDGMRNYLTRDDILPQKFLEIAYQEVKKYGVRYIGKEIVHAEKLSSGVFRVKDQNGLEYFSKRLLIATGLRDILPKIPGIDAFYGSSVFHCPYCDGWEVRDQNIGVYARHKNGFELALSLQTWSKRVTLYTDGRNYLKPVEREHLDRRKIQIFGERIRGLEGTGNQLAKIVLANNKKQKCDALFFVNGYEQQCSIAESLGCEMSAKKVVLTNRLQQANIHGLYVAGDVAKDMHFVVVAAAEGAKAAVSINKELQKEEFENL